MVLYYCENCNKPFAQKCDYLTHRKTHAKNIYIHHIATTSEGRVECMHCKKTFANANTLHTHIDTKCKLSPAQTIKDQQLTLNIKIAKMEIKQREIEQQQKGIEQQQKNFENKILHKIDGITDTINNIETVTNINIQINRPFYINDIKTEKSIFEYLSNEQLNHVVQLGGDAVSKLIEYKHYNKNCPENHNIYIHKQKAEIAKVFMDSKFVNVNIDELLDFLIQKSQNEITAILNLPIIKLDYKKQRTIYNLQLRIKENAPATISMLKEELRKLMKNNAELVINTFKHMQATLNQTMATQLTFIEM